MLESLLTTNIPQALNDSGCLFALSGSLTGSVHSKTELGSGVFAHLGKRGVLS